MLQAFLMKKLVEKLLKNEMLKKVSMSITFVIMCCVACFINWKAVVGAEGDNGTAQTQQTRSAGDAQCYIQCTPEKFWKKELN